MGIIVYNIDIGGDNMINCNLRKICFDKDIRTITELSSITNISRPTLYKLFNNENVHSVKLEILNTVCKTLDCKILDLIEYTED